MVLNHIFSVKKQVFACSDEEAQNPVILPVVPWGIANSFLAGGRLSDFLLFGGLAMYAMAGCPAQDLRIIQNEGSVGTIFCPSELKEFFAGRSFFHTFWCCHRWTATHSRHCERSSIDCLCGWLLCWCLYLRYFTKVVRDLLANLSIFIVYAISFMRMT
jgi:hypothetical protein